MKWDRLDAELVDTLASMPKSMPIRRCVYCGAKTRAVSQVCTAHSDLPSNDPHMNVQAGRFTPRVALEEAQASPDGAAPVNGSGDPSLSTCVSSSAAESEPHAPVRVDGGVRGLTSSGLVALT